ncbi:MAG: fatty acid desaturase [Mariniblastus sp.]|jgi:fatty acid desaturase
MSPSAPPPLDWVRSARIALKNSEQDFHQVKPWIYWRDMILGAAIAYTAAGIYVNSPAFSVWQIVSFLVAVFWLYRVGSLVHEVAHLGGHELTSFKVAWNVLVGIPTLTPSTFFTGHHRDHHTQRVYGTPQDPEYVVNVCRRGSAMNLILYFLFVAAFPLVVFLRFFLVPLTFVSPKIREFVLRRLSAFTFNWRYERPIDKINRKTFAALELACWLRAIAIPGAVLLGVTDPSRMFLLYSLGATVVIMNQLRQLADHHFEGDGQNLTMSEHIMDSCNYTGKDPLTWLFFPFAIQYHALHHMFPSMPYHNLAGAHGFLLQKLPSDSPYRDLTQPGWWSVAKQMLRKDEVVEPTVESILDTVEKTVEKTTHPEKELTSV